ncbi:MAG: NF038122 family metalloprotease [Planctomycetaceae bacterium]
MRRTTTPVLQPAVIILSVHDAFNYVISEFQNLFTDNINININVKAGNVGLGQSATFLYGKFDYSQIQALLTADQANGSDNTATLQSDERRCHDQFWLSTAEAKALGLNPGNSSDGTFTFSNAQAYTFDPNNRQVAGRFDWIGVAEHEVSEIMGRISLVKQAT